MDNKKSYDLEQTSPYTFSLVLLPNSKACRAHCTQNPRAVISASPPGLLLWSPSAPLHFLTRLPKARPGSSPNLCSLRSFRWQLSSPFFRPNSNTALILLWKRKVPSTCLQAHHTQAELYARICLPPDQTTRAQALGTPRAQHRPGSHQVSTDA